MINIFFIKNLCSLILIILLQVIIFNQIIFFNKYSPLIYIMWIYIYSTNINKYQCLIFSFLLGLLMDILCFTKGIHASSCLLIGFSRLSITKIIINYPCKNSKNLIKHASWLQKIFLITIMVFIHHFWMFMIEFFDYKSMTLILHHTFYNSIITIISSIFLLIILS